jgi:hypothetical protein
VATQNRTLYVESKSWNGNCSSGTRVPLYLVVKTVPALSAYHDTSICGDGTVQLVATASLGTVRWYDTQERSWNLGSEDGYLGTGSNFTSPLITGSTTFYAQASNQGCKSIGRKVVYVTYNYAAGIPSSVGASTCPGSTASISAMGGEGDVINWYMSATGGSSIGSGNTFITPALAKTKNYYAEAYNGFCYSTRIAVTVMVYPVDTPTVKIEKCMGASYLFGAQTINTSGTYNKLFTGIHGCDSSVTLKIAFVDTIRNRFTASFCAKGSYQFGSKTLTAPGVYATSGLKSVNGCDSIAILTLITNRVDTTYITASVCNGHTYNFFGSLLPAAGVYTHKLINVKGCDSVIILNLKLLQNTASDVFVSACSKYTWLKTNTTYMASGLYNDTIPNVVGCDSVISLHLIIKTPTSSTQTVSACTSYTWPINNVNYTVSGTYKGTIPNAAGCDSVITLNLTIKNPTSSATTVAACNSYKWSLTNLTYAVSGTYTKTLVNAAGCDSVVSLNLTINTATSSSKSIAACGSYVWPVSNVNYTASGAYNVTLTNKAGCDSIITLNLTIKKPTASTNVRFACGPFKWIDGITYTSSNNTAIYLLPNAAGCDSVMTLNLTINSPSTSSTSFTACGSYLWNGTTYTTSGAKTKTLTNKAGCDSVATLNLTINNATSGSASITACSSYIWNGTIYTTSGANTKTLTNKAGCDSVATLNLTINNTITKDTTINACKSATYKGVTYTRDTTITQKFVSVSKCDSVVTAHIHIDQGTASILITQNGPILTANVVADSYQWLDCNNNNAKIPDATAAKFTASGPGSYAVAVKLGLCLDVSKCQSVIITDLANILVKQGLELYPSPTSDLLMVDFGTVVTEAKIELINPFGQTVLKTSVNNIILTKLDLSIFANGVYMLQVTRDGQLVQHKVVVQK